MFKKCFKRFYHKKFDNYRAIQIFTKYGPLAFLPISRDKTSIVYSVQKKFRLNLDQIKNEILKYSKKYDLKKLNYLEKFELKYNFSRKFIHKNIVCFGDALHKIHPLAGQGFNMTLRDLKLLLNIIENKINYGLEIDRSTLIEFKDKSKHLNYIFGIGINLINEFFKLDSRFNGKLSDNIFSFLDANELFKKNSVGGSLLTTSSNPHIIISNSFVGVFSSVSGVLRNGITPILCLFIISHICE